MADPIAEHADPSAAQAPPPLSLVEQRDTLAAALEENNLLKREKETLETTIADLMQKGSVLRDHLANIEKNPLSMALTNIDAGGFLDTCGDHLRTLLKQVQERNEKGKLTVSLEIKPFKEGQLVFTGNARISEPKKESPKAVFFASEDGTISRKDPRQQEFGFPNSSDFRG